MYLWQLASRHFGGLVLLGLLLGLAACGGGGGGDGGGTATPVAGGGPSTPVAQGPSAAIRYSLGPVTTANTTIDGFQTFSGLAVTPSGYRVVWSTASFDANMAVQRAWFEQRFDQAGQRIGNETAIPQPTQDLSSGASSRVGTPDGGTLAFALSDQMRPALSIQHLAADGTPVDTPIALGGASQAWISSALALPNGTVVAIWQPASSVGPGEIRTAVLVPGPR